MTQDITFIVHFISIIITSASFQIIGHQIAEIGDLQSKAYIYHSHRSYGSGACVQSSWSSAQGFTSLQSPFFSGTPSLLQSSLGCWKNLIPCGQRTKLPAFLLTVSQEPFSASRGPQDSLPLAHSQTLSHHGSLFPQSQETNLSNFQSPVKSLPYQVSACKRISPLVN